MSRALRWGSLFFGGLVLGDADILARRLVTPLPIWFGLYTITKHNVGISPVDGCRYSYCGALDPRRTQERTETMITVLSLHYIMCLTQVLL